MLPLPRDSTFYRMARRIQDRLASERPSPTPLPPESIWRRLRQVCQQLAIAQAHGWDVAWRHLRRDYRSICTNLFRELQLDMQGLDDPDDLPVASVRDILTDLAALRAEFESVEVSLKERTVSVVTDSIVLEGVDLGRFEIVLRIDRITEGAAYDVVPLEPNCAVGSSHSHPHISNESLCEGDGRRPIESALEQGRIFDFFILVRQILQTYNPHSAYVPLSRWNGRECRDCGTIASEDESTSCEECGAEVCCDCSGSCNACHCTCCSSCRCRCQKCEIDVCDHCSHSCSGCLELFCPACLDDGRCAACRRDEESSDETDPETSETAENPSEPFAPVHADGLGQVPVPA